LQRPSDSGDLEFKMHDHTALRVRAEQLLTLVRAQARRAFVVELAGTPKAGKSTSVALVQQFFKQCGFRVHLLKERAAECPLPMKGHFFFNSWTTCSMIAEVLETVDTDTDLLILDRGFFDSLVWLELQRRRGQVTDEEAEVFSNFVLLARWSRLVDVTIVMQVEPDVAMVRENERRIIPRKGSIMSPSALAEVNGALNDARRRYGSHFKLVDPPTQVAGPVEDNAALVEKLLENFEQWADPVTLAVPKCLLEQRFQQPTAGPQLLQNGAAREALDSLLPHIRLDRRSKLENDPGFVQLVACALPR
jgi:thymidylate kinase